jgi:hypothetical protein
MPDSATTQPATAAAAASTADIAAPPAAVANPAPTPVATPDYTDDRADLTRRAAYWKSILSEHPMSSEFIDAHDDLSLLLPEDIESQSKTLALMEKQIEQGAEDARRFLDESTRFDSSGQRPLKELLEALYQVDQHGIIIDDGPRFGDMIQNNNVTVGEMIDRYRNYYQRLAKKFLNGSHKRAAILNSVRTGEASRSLMPDNARPETDVRKQYSLEPKQ